MCNYTYIQHGNKQTITMHKKGNSDVIFDGDPMKYVESRRIIAPAHVM